MADLKIFANTIEEEAVSQINTLAEQKGFCNEKIRIMPDVHAGKGCVVGFTSTIGEYVISNVVGVDIGCGMLTAKLGKVGINFEKLDKVIRANVPSGRNVHDGRIYKFDDLQNLKCYRELRDTRRLERSIGTLGGGNHFIEVDVDNSGNYYLVIHSGSRNLGKQVADYYQDLAYELLQGKDELLSVKAKMIEEYKAQGRKGELQEAIRELYRDYQVKDSGIQKDLAYLTGEYMRAYLHDMEICQRFAVLNRSKIRDQICSEMKWKSSNSFETIHNYIDLESMIIRKGAIDASEGKELLIPLNMRDGCILGVGKGNPDWNYSAPHGAGRIMSRTKARESVSLSDYQNSMEGIYTTSVCASTVDEAPEVYKKVSDIVDVIGETVEILNIIKPVYNYKASE